MGDPPDLFAPSIREEAIALAPKGARPWSLDSVSIVGFFGGSFAATWYALDNLERMGAADGEAARTVRRIGYTAWGLATLFQCAWILATASDDDADLRPLRIVMRLIGLGVGWWLAKQLVGPQRQWLVRVNASAEALDSAWWPGIKAIFLWGTLGALPAAAVAVWARL